MLGEVFGVDDLTFHISEIGNIPIGLLHLGHKAEELLDEVVFVVAQKGLLDAVSPELVLQLPLGQLLPLLHRLRQRYPTLAAEGVERQETRGVFGHHGAREGRVLREVEKLVVQVVLRL